MLTDDERQTIRAAEEFRQLIRDNQAAKAQAPATRGERIIAFFNTSLGGWILGTLVVGGFGYLWTQAQAQLHRDELKAAQARANAQQDVVVVTQLLPPLAHVGTPENRLASEIIFHLKQTNGIDARLADALNGVLLNVAAENQRRARESASAGDPAQHAVYIAAAEAAASAADAELPRASKTSLSPSAPAASGAPKRIYVQIANEDQRARGEQIRAAFRDKGYLMPGIEDVGSRAPAKPDVRYFRPEDKDAAEEVARELSQMGIDVGEARQISMRAQPGQLEIWLAK